MNHMWSEIAVFLNDLPCHQDFELCLVYIFITFFNVLMIHNLLDVMHNVNLTY